MPDTRGAVISQIPLPNRQPSRAFFGAATDFIADVSNSTWFTPGIPITPQAPAEERPRRFDYPTGINISIIPRAEEQITMDQLRNLAELWDLLRLVIETRKDQIAGIPWVIRPRKEPDEKNVDYKARAKEDKRAQTATELFMRPDGEHLWQSWIRILLEEMFVLDALSIYPFKDRDGKLWVDILDGSTIKRLLDSQGRTPRPPDMAYEQIIKGVPAFGFKADQLFYRPRNQRAWKIYGYSPVEQIVITVNLAIRRQLYKLNYYTQGNMPEAIVQMPDTWPPDRIKQFQEWWNTMLAGDLDRRRQFFFVPGFGGKDAISYPKQDVIKDEMDEWLARVVCYTFSVSPQPFIKEGMSRFGVQQQQQMAKAEGLIPTLSWIAEVLSDVMENGLGWKGLEFVFQEDTEPDLLKRAQIQEIRVRNGLSQIDEVREENGDEEIGVGAGIITGTGFVPFPGQDGAPELPGPGGGWDDFGSGAGPGADVVFATNRRGGDNTSEGGPEPGGNGKPKNGGPKNGGPATKRLHGAGGRHAFTTPAQQARAARMEQLLSTFLSTQAAHAANRLAADYGRHAPARKFASDDVPLDSSEVPVQIVLHGDDAVAYQTGAPLQKATRNAPAFHEFNQWMQARGWRPEHPPEGQFIQEAKWTHPDHGTVTAELDLPPLVRGPMVVHRGEITNPTDSARAMSFEQMREHVQAFEAGQHPDYQAFHRPIAASPEFQAANERVDATYREVATGMPRMQSAGPGAYPFTGHGARTYEGMDAHDPSTWGGPHYHPDQPRDEHGQWVMRYGGTLGKAMLEELHLTIAAAVKAAVSELPRGESSIVPDITVNVASPAAAPITVAAAPTPDVRVEVAAAPIPPPAQVTIEKGAVQVTTPVTLAPPAVTVAAAPAPDVIVEAPSAPPPAQVTIVNKQKRPRVKVKTSVQANLTPKATRKVVKRNVLGEVESIDPVPEDDPPSRKD